ncbi:MAG: hypothetical protein FVQ79_11285 [Planctomycetes bacterium]|nr:hypothetical protein [Planctomycetota bacterium]
MSGSVKSIRHHNVAAGRDTDDAHAQYLRLAETATQTMAGSLNLNNNNINNVLTLQAKTISSSTNLELLAATMDICVTGLLDIDVGALEVCVLGLLDIDAGYTNIHGSVYHDGELEITTCDDPPLSLVMTALTGESTEGFMWFEGEECVLAIADAPIWCCGSAGSYSLDGSLMIKVAGSKRYIRYYAAI